MDWNGRGRGAFGGLYETYYLVIKDQVHPDRIFTICSAYFKTLRSPDLDKNVFILARPRNDIGIFKINDAHVTDIFLDNLRRPFNLVHYNAKDNIVVVGEATSGLSVVKICNGIRDRINSSIGDHVDVYPGWVEYSNGQELDLLSTCLNLLKSELAEYSIEVHDRNNFYKNRFKH
jgi:hypothetical protein